MYKRETFEDIVNEITTNSQNCAVHMSSLSGRLRAAPHRPLLQKRDCGKDQNLENREGLSRDQLVPKMGMDSAIKRPCLFGVLRPLEGSTKPRSYSTTALLEFKRRSFQESQCCGVYRDCVTVAQWPLRSMDAGQPPAAAGLVLDS